MTRFRTYWAIVVTYRNWPEIFWAKLTKRKGDSVLVLRAGVRFHTANLNSNLMTILEVWHERQYGSPPTGVVIDLGANIGAFSVYAAHAGAIVHAFEPEPENYRLLAANANGYPIVPQQMGVAGMAGQRFLSVEGPSSGKNSFFGKQEGLTIPCTTLAQIMEGIPRCDFLKIDIEGAEYEVLYAASDVLHRVQMIVLEVHRVAGEERTSLEAFLRKHGFDLEYPGPCIILARANERQVRIHSGLMNTASS